MDDNESSGDHNGNIVGNTNINNDDDDNNNNNNVFLSAPNS